jgi:hypothetical protein
LYTGIFYFRSQSDDLGVKNKNGFPEPVNAAKSIRLKDLGDASSLNSSNSHLSSVSSKSKALLAGLVNSPLEGGPVLLDNRPGSRQSTPKGISIDGTKINPRASKSMKHDFKKEKGEQEIDQNSQAKQNIPDFTSTLNKKQQMEYDEKIAKLQTKENELDKRARDLDLEVSKRVGEALVIASRSPKRLCLCLY